MVWQIIPDDRRSIAERRQMAIEVETILPVTQT